jgi:hypothetical protein
LKETKTGKILRRSKLNCRRRPIPENSNGKQFHAWSVVQQTQQSSRLGHDSISATTKDIWLRLNVQKLPASTFTALNSGCRLLLTFDIRVHYALSLLRSIDFARPIHHSMLRTALRRTAQSAFPRQSTQSTTPFAALCRRGYADAAPAKTSENLKLSLSVPHKSIFSNKEVYVPYSIPSSFKVTCMGTDG